MYVYSCIHFCFFRSCGCIIFAAVLQPTQTLPKQRHELLVQNQNWNIRVDIQSGEKKTKPPLQPGHLYPSWRRKTRAQILLIFPLEVTSSLLYRGPTLVFATQKLLALTHPFQRWEIFPLYLTDNKSHLQALPIWLWPVYYILCCLNRMASAFALSIMCSDW